MNISMEFSTFELVNVPIYYIRLINSSSNKQFQSFGPSLTKTGMYGSKNITIEFTVFQNSIGTKFHRKLFWVSGTNFRKTSIFSLKQKSEHCHQILDVRISQSTKLQFKQIILVLWSKFPQKNVFLV